MFAQVGDRKGEKIILYIEGNPKIFSTPNSLAMFLGEYRQKKGVSLFHPVAANFFRRQLEVAGLFSMSKVICGATVFVLYMYVTVSLA